jgi:hypothetical protein
MDLASAYYLGVSLLLFLVFVAIIAKTCSRRRRDQEESPKYRMMDE